MRLTDPAGREAVIACGAALFNVRMAVGQLGFRPVVDLLPKPGNPAFLAHVGYGAHAPARAEETVLARAMPLGHAAELTRCVGPYGVPDGVLPSPSRPHPARRPRLTRPHQVLRQPAPHGHGQVEPGGRARRPAVVWPDGQGRPMPAPASADQA
ncbi:nitroreductase family protein [Streptomyces lincolnensis]|uniref:Nitroreductase family protein n=1 Tax=Streptomyces lincolnensis TaxID=1915 RepID=A0A1B1MNF9_STRLN|nr:nitroreductase family protein [Streptomyces lincolnensis]AXG59036.1 nitroreductase family protein [Streptomyces lincolnensis]